MEMESATAKARLKARQLNLALVTKIFAGDETLVRRIILPYDFLYCFLLFFVPGDETLVRPIILPLFSIVFCAG